ncbi:hypothetical protein IKQ26_03995 [bacterium]|nr:hypothetical protein [bacterium]
MKIDNINSNNDFMAQFLAKQDMPKSDNSQFAQLAMQPQKDSFVPSADKEVKPEVKSDDTFVKTPAVKPEEVKAEEVKEEVIAEEKPEPEAEVKETEEVKEEVKDEIPQAPENAEQKPSDDENVKKKTNIIDKVKNFFKNLFKKKNIEVTNAEQTVAKSSAGSVN